jgi:HAD superfamily hydrolase (TIGR01509 family)
MRTWPRAAVFDFDGLLVDSAHCWESAYAQIAGANGRSLDDLDLSAMAGASVAGAAKLLSGAFGSPIEEHELRLLLHQSFVDQPPCELPGARTLVLALATHTPVAIATNAPAELVTAVLEQIDLIDALPIVVSAERTGAGKPAPDVYLEACRRLDADPSDAIAFEDSPLGAQAARGAGLFVVGVPPRPGMGLDADLIVPRLDDRRLLLYLGLESEQPSTRSGGNA